MTADLALVVDPSVPRASDGSAAHAMVRGLRRARDEVQLTNVIAAIASTDSTFATEFVHALLAQAYDDCPATRDAQRRLQPIPERLHGDRERHLYDSNGASLGRVDLIFAEPGDDSRFTLLVENKLYSALGPEQVARYHAGLRVLRGRAGKGGLIAVTRDVPTRGELHRPNEEWLGSVRWARLLPRLQGLTVKDPGVAAQWLLLLEVMDEEGDLGMTNI